MKLKNIAKGDLKDFAPQSNFLNIVLKYFWDKGGQDLDKATRLKDFKKFVELLPQSLNDNAGCYDIADYDGEDIAEVPLLQYHYLLSVKDNYPKDFFVAMVKQIEENCAVIYDDTKNFRS